MAQLNVAQFNSALLQCSRSKKLLTAEASDICIRTFQPLYDDAADIGLALRNPKTRNVTRWSVAEEHTQEGDITHWTLHPCSESVYHQPALEGWTLVIFND